MSEHDLPPAPDRTPRLVQGRRQISIAALQERIESQFLAENSPDLLLEAPDESARRALIREAADYVLAVESVVLTRPERLALLDALYSDLFRFGPLDQYVQDSAITELTIDGPDSIHIRRGAAAMQPVDSYFDDADHLSKIMQRVLSTAGVQYSADNPFVEVGTVMLGRPVRLTVAAPPISPLLHVEIRLHPAQPLSLDDLIGRAMISRTAADLLLSALNASRGVMIAGDVGTGKTTLLQALFPALPGHSAVVERSAELRPPPDMDRYTGADFAAGIETALDKRPLWLVLDELRWDEAHAMWAALTAEPRPHLLWAFRGATDPSRLRAAFSMSVRRGQPAVEQAQIVSALIDQLPVVVLLARRDDALRVITIGEWVRDGDTVMLKPCPI